MVNQEVGLNKGIAARIPHGIALDDIAIGGAREAYEIAAPFRPLAGRRGAHHREACVEGRSLVTDLREAEDRVAELHRDAIGLPRQKPDRPALRRLLADIEAERIDVVVVYKIDRLSRSLMDFAKLVEIFDRYDVTFVSVTQAFSTTTSMGRLTLNILLSFAQFEREVIGERIRDKLQPPAPGGCGWVAACRSVTMYEIASSWGTR
jgi:hypothetical protein